MNRNRFENMRNYATSHNLQIVKTRRYMDDDELVDFALVGFDTFSELKTACDALDLVPMAIRIIKGSNLHNSVKSFDQEKLLYEFNNRARLCNLDSSSSSYHSDYEMRFPFIVNRVGSSFYTKQTTNRTMFVSLISWLSNFWENILSVMTNDNVNIDEKRCKIQELSITLNDYNRECVFDNDLATANLHDFLEKVVEGLQLATEKEENEVFLKYIDSLTMIVKDYINMNDASMLVILDYWLSKCNYEIVPIKFSMVDKFSENIIHILGAVAYGEYTII